MRHRSKSPILAAALAAGLIVAASAQKPNVSEEDRIRIAEGRVIADQLGDRLWTGWNEAPFAVLLVTDTHEFLIGHPAPTADFELLGYDSLLQSNVFARRRVYDPEMLATFPAVDGVPTIVIGQTANTEASHSTRWVMTLLHEHFHQWQMSQPDYYAAVDSLGLSGGDQSGMWMLNYAFPYDDTEVAEAFDAMCRRLANAVEDDGSQQETLAEFLNAKERFRETLADDDYRYFCFQVWQEGISRYTEYMIAASAEAAYQPTQAFLSLPDFVSFGEDAEITREMIRTELAKMSLKKDRRTAFYFVGAAEGMLLDRVNPGWRARYLQEPFNIDAYYPGG